MSSPQQAELRLTGSKDEAVDAIVAALPREAIVRDEDDGVGRFAGERTLLIVGPDKARLMLFRGSWGTLKGRLDTPQLDVALEHRDGRLIAKLTPEPDKPAGVGSHVSDVLGQSVTIGAIVVAYHMFQSIPMDYGRIAILAIVGGVAWSLVGHFVPKKRDRGLEGLVRDALAPMAAKKTPKKAQKADAAEGA